MDVVFPNFGILIQLKTSRTNRSTTRHLETPGANSYSFVYWLIIACNRVQAILIPCLYSRLLRSLIQTNSMARKHHYLI